MFGFQTLRVGHKDAQIDDNGVIQHTAGLQFTNTSQSPADTLTAGVLAEHWPSLSQSF